MVGTRNEGELGSNLKIKGSVSFSRMKSCLLKADGLRLEAIIT
jgi:hypothetical protein